MAKRKNKNFGFVAIFIIIILAYFSSSFWEIEWVEGVYHHTRNFSWQRYWFFLWFINYPLLVSLVPISIYFFTKNKRLTKVLVLFSLGCMLIGSIIEDFSYAILSGRGVWIYTQLKDSQNYIQYRWLIGPFPWFYFLFLILGTILLVFSKKEMKDD